MEQKAKSQIAAQRVDAADPAALIDPSTVVHIEDVENEGDV
ncbi:hypothetical protein [Streptomyces sp. SID10853]|nr:hypothetical protein [Streptomyces sp. SID10853]